MSEALQFFLEEENIITALDYPDAAIDYVFMLKKNDWQKLSDSWKNYSDDWKEGVCYLAGFIPLKQSNKILLMAFYEPNPKIKTQALLSIHQSINEEIEETDKCSFQFTSNDRKQLINELKLRNHENELYPEFEDLLDFLETNKTP